MRKLLVALAGFTAIVAIKPTLKCGGPVQTTGDGGKGKKAWEMVQTWVNTNSVKFKMDIEWKPYGNTTVIETGVKALTDPSKCASGLCVELLIPPYGSTHVKNIIDYIHPNWTGVLIAWGGASDSIFTKCANRKFKCFGTFTVGTQYMRSGLEGLNAASSTDLKVAVIDNGKDAFSSSVCKGAKDYVSVTAGLNLAVYKSFSQKSAVTAAEKTMVNTLHTNHTPDVWVLCGKSGFVGPIVPIVTAKNPKAIIGTNIITSTTRATYANDAAADCLLMPTQWAGGVDKDSITGITTASFKVQMGDNAVYHAASAAASAIAVAHAMETTTGSLGDRMAKVDTPSFYGLIKFNSDGSIMKPMYTQQRLAGVAQVVLPARIMSVQSGQIASSKTSDFQPDYVRCKAGTGKSTTRRGTTTKNATGLTTRKSENSAAVAAGISVVAVSAPALLAW